MGAPYKVNPDVKWVTDKYGNVLGFMNERNEFVQTDNTQAIANSITRGTRFSSGWTLLDLPVGMTSTDASVRIVEGRYEFKGTIYGTFTTGKIVASLPVGLPLNEISQSNCMSSIGAMRVTFDATRNVVMGTVSGSPAWLSLEALSTSVLQDAPRANLLYKGSTLSIVHISTAGVPLPAPVTKTYIAGTLRIDAYNSEKEALREVEISISGHGNSTWTAPKKSMKIKFSSPTSILGMPAAKSWRALANYYDQTLIRNATAFEMARRIYEPWTPRNTFCEIFLNGEYQGVYQMTEPVKDDEDRLPVNLPKSSATGLAGTGTFLLEINERMESEGSLGFRTVPTNVPIQFEDPDTPSGSQISYLQAHFNAFDAALMGGNWLDPVLGYAKYIDMESWAAWYLVSEITHNNDAVLYSSCKLYKLPDTATELGKIKFGPLWDSDLSLGNSFHVASSSIKDWSAAPEEWYIRSATWFDRLMKDPAFVVVLRNRWELLKKSLQGPAGIIAWGLALSENISYAATNDATRWGFSGDSKERYSMAIDWLQRRIAWLDLRLTIPTITNIVTNPRPTIGMSGYAGYAAPGGSGAMAAAAGNPFGGNSARYTWSGASTSGNGGIIYGGAIPVITGRTYSVVVAFRCSKAQPLSLRIEQKNGGSLVGVIATPAITPVPGELTYIRINNTGLLPLVTNFGLSIYNANGVLWNIADWLEFNGIMVIEGPTPDNLLFADPGTSNKWSWDGTANASTSKGWPY